MSVYSSREVADKLGISLRTLERYIAAKKIPYPKVQQIGGVRFRLCASPSLINQVLEIQNIGADIRSVVREA